MTPVPFLRASTTHDFAPAPMPHRQLLHRHNDPHGHQKRHGRFLRKPTRRSLRNSYLCSCRVCTPRYLVASPLVISAVKQAVRHCRTPIVVPRSHNVTKR